MKTAMALLAVLSVGCASRAPRQPTALHSPDYVENPEATGIAYGSPAPTTAAVEARGFSVVYGAPHYWVRTFQKGPGHFVHVYDQDGRHRKHFHYVGNFLAFIHDGEACP